MKKIYSSDKERRRAEYLRAKARRMERATPDPITLLTQDEKAYIAGLFDGEGCFRVGFVGPRRYTYYPIVFIGMTHLGVIQWLQGKLGSGTVKVNNSTRVREGWKPEHSIRLYGKRAQLFCQSLLPYFVVKAEQARIISEFPCDMRIAPGHRITEEVQRQRLNLYEQMQPLNKRGR